MDQNIILKLRRNLKGTPHIFFAVSSKNNHEKEFESLYYDILDLIESRMSDSLENLEFSADFEIDKLDK